MYPNPNIAEELNFLVPQLQEAADRLDYLSRNIYGARRTERAIFRQLEEISDDLNFVSRYLRNLSANEHDRNKYNPVKRSRIPEVGDIPGRMQVVGRNYNY